MLMSTGCLAPLVPYGSLFQAASTLTSFNCPLCFNFSYKCKSTLKVVVFVVVVVVVILTAYEIHTPHLPLLT